MTDIEHRIRALLPADLAAHCQVAGIREGCLHLTTESPAWAARLRFQAPRLIQQLTRQGTLAVRTVQVRIIPKATARPAPTGRKPRLTAENARLLEQTAQAIKDPRLAQALARLARRRTEADR